MHFILQAGKRGGVAVGVKLVVLFEYHAQGILRARKCLQVPGILPKEIAALYDLQTQIGDVAHLGYIGGKFQNFTGAEGRFRFARSRLFHSLSRF